MWALIDHKNDILREFASEELARSHLDGMGGFFQKNYKVVEQTGNETWDTIIIEGLIGGDLSGILLPEVSIDEYVPSDPNTDNIVIAFFIKGVPEAVIPFRTFCQNCDGVLDVDYGNSETRVNSHVVYVEMDRKTVLPSVIDGLVQMVSRVADLDPADFTMDFPHTNKRFPYDTRVIKKYLDSRTRRDNLLAQRKAEQEDEPEQDENVQDGQRNVQSDQEVEESLNMMVERMFV